MSSASSMCQTYPVYTSDAPEDVSTALHGSGESSLCTQVGAAPASPLYVLYVPCTVLYGRMNLLYNSGGPKERGTQL